MIVKMTWYVSTLGKKGNNSYLKRLQIRQAFKTKDRQKKHEHI